MIITGVFNEKMLDTSYSGRINTYRHANSDLLLGYIQDEEVLDFDRNQEENNNNILIKKLAFSLNYRDKDLISLFYQRCQILEDPAFAGIGSDFVAEVISCGPKVKNLSPGDRVIPNAAYPNINAPNLVGGVPTNFASEEYEILKCDQVAKIPNSMPIEVAAGFTVGAQTSYSIIRRLGIKSGTNFLVSSGRSNTSIFVIQAIKALGISCNIYVVTSAPNTENDFFYKMGVKQVINIPNKALVSEVQNALSHYPMFQYIFDPIFNVYINALAPKLDYFGKYVTCGALNQPEGNPAIDTSILVKFILKNASFIGNCLGEEGDLQSAIADFNSDKLQVTIDSIYSYKEIESFVTRTYYDNNRYGKVICKLV